MDGTAQAARQVRGPSTFGVESILGAHRLARHHLSTRCTSSSRMVAEHSRSSQPESIEDLGLGDAQETARWTMGASKDAQAKRLRGPVNYSGNTAPCEERRAPTSHDVRRRWREPTSLRTLDARPSAQRLARGLWVYY